jgi:TonB family protein
MRNRIAVALFVLLSILMFAPNHAPAQESSEGGRKVVSKVLPQYPGLARSMKIQGNVKADVLVAPSGKVTSIEVKGGHPVLAQSAQDALRQWKWEPASHESHEIVELRFTP